MQPKNLGRRRSHYRHLFLGGLIALVSCSQENVSPIAPIAESSAPMEYVDICNRANECKKFSRLVMGTDHLVQGNWTGAGEPELTETQAFAVLDAAAKAGINFFDTSPIYVGGVENKLGKWKAAASSKILVDNFYASPKLNPDRKIYVLSKGGFPFDLFWAKKLEAGTHATELKHELQSRGILDPTAALTEKGETPLHAVPPGTYASRLYGDKAQISRRVAEELGHTVANLNGDITVYLMHRDDGDAVEFKSVQRPKTPVPVILEALSDNAVASKFGILGWSNWETDRIEESIRLAAANPNLPLPAINSPYFSLFEMSERTIHALGVQVTHTEMMDPNFQKGIKIMPYSPLGGFSILDKPEPKWENAKADARKKYEEKDPYWQNVYHAIFTPENEQRWHRVVGFTAQFNADHKTSYTVDQMINAYALAHPRTDLLAIGAITIEQVNRTVGALALSKQLTTDDLEYLYRGK